MLCASCGPKSVRLALPPAELSECADEPAAPDLPAVDWTSVDAARPLQAARDTMMLAYVLALRSAWGDCKADTDALAAWREQAR